jgi:hypothetical protein
MIWLIGAAGLGCFWVGFGIGAALVRNKWEDEQRTSDLRRRLGCAP